MDSHVIWNGTCETESLTTDITGIWFESRMDTIVQVQHPSHRKPFVAYRADVRLDSCVLRVVHFKVVAVFKYFLALLARILFRFCFNFGLQFWWCYFYMTFIIAFGIIRYIYLGLYVCIIIYCNIWNDRGCYKSAELLMKFVI